jgi:hypothetical protein
MNNIKTYDLFNESSDDKRLNFILDKISNYGETSLTQSERDYLNDKPTKQKEVDYNKYIIEVLKDFNRNKINKETVIKFLKKYGSQDELIEFLILLTREGILDKIIK